MVPTLMLLGMCLALCLAVGLGMHAMIDRTKRSLVRVPVDRRGRTTRR